MPIEDKCLQVTTHNEGQNIFVINQAAGRILRQELIREMQGYIESLKIVDLQEFNDHMEVEAEKFESNFIKLFSEQSESSAPKVPVFDFATTV